MSSFKEKNIKYSSFCNNVINKSMIKFGTLDNVHQEKMNEFDKKTKNLGKLKIRLKKTYDEAEQLELQDQANYTDEEISRRAALKLIIKELKEEIDLIETGQEELDYFNNTIDILFKYHTLDVIHI